MEFSFDFELCGPYITFTKDDYSLKLKSYFFTENVKNNTLYKFTERSVGGYSFLNSPIIDELDYFRLSQGDNYTYSFKRNGGSYTNSVFKFTDDGIVKVYLSEKDIVTQEKKEYIKEFAYIIQSRMGFAGIDDVGIIFFDGEKEYYYTDTYSGREERILAEQGVNTNELNEEIIVEIAEKKEDLYNDLQLEFSKQGINVIINRASGEIAIDSSVLFGGDSSEITNLGKELLNKFIVAYTSIISKEKYDGFIEKTLVEGHTALLDGSTYESGLPLSVERAENVKNYCVSANVGVDLSKLANNIEAVGLSNSKPIYDSNGEIDLKASRRVSFRIVVDVESVK